MSPFDAAAPTRLLCTSPEDDLRFMHLAMELSYHSKDPSTQVGAVLVSPEGQVVSSGWNRFPEGIPETPEAMADRELKMKLIVHAEMTAILDAARRGVRVQGCTLYVVARSGDVVWGGSPCVRCTAEAIPSGVARVVGWVPEGIPERWQADLLLARSLLDRKKIPLDELPRSGM